MFPLYIVFIIQVICFKSVINLMGISLTLSLTSYGGLQEALSIPMTYHWYSLFNDAALASSIAGLIAFIYWITVLVNFALMCAIIQNRIKYGPAKGIRNRQH